MLKGRKTTHRLLGELSMCTGAPEGGMDSTVTGPGKGEEELNWALLHLLKYRCREGHQQKAMGETKDVQAGNQGR